MQSNNPKCYDSRKRADAILALANFGDVLEHSERPNRSFSEVIGFRGHYSKFSSLDEIFMNMIHIIDQSDNKRIELINT